MLQSRRRQAWLRNHPILRLFPPERKEGDPPPITIAVGSDDPITFSTWLLHEYSLLYEAAVAAGYPDRVVHTWLEKIQRMGRRAPDSGAGSGGLDTRTCASSDWTNIRPSTRSMVELS